MDLVKYESKTYNNFNLVQSTNKFPVDDQVGTAKAQAIGKKSPFKKEYITDGEYLDKGSSKRNKVMK
jgi:hypothetical protein